MNFANLSIEGLNVFKSGKSFKLVDSTKNPLTFVSCRLYLPFGTSSFRNDYSGMNDYSISCYSDPDFSEFCTRLDGKISEAIQPYIHGELQPMLKQNKDYPKLLRLKLPRDSNGNFNFVVFDEKENKIKVTENNVYDVFCKKRAFKCVMQCDKISSWNDKVYVSWILTQARYMKPEHTTDINVDTHVDFSTCLLD